MYSFELKEPERTRSLGLLKWKLTNYIITSNVMNARVIHGPRAISVTKQTKRCGLQKSHLPLLSTEGTSSFASLFET